VVGKTGKVAQNFSLCLAQNKKCAELVYVSFAVAVRSATFERADEAVHRVGKCIQLLVCGTLGNCQRFDLCSVFNEHFHALQDELADGRNLTIMLRDARF
jgi:hypothetical protein